MSQVRYVDTWAEKRDLVIKTDKGWRIITTLDYDPYYNTGCPSLQKAIHIEDASVSVTATPALLLTTELFGYMDGNWTSGVRRRVEACRVEGDGIVCDEPVAINFRWLDYPIGPNDFERRKGTPPPTTPTDATYTVTPNGHIKWLSPPK